MNIKTTTVEKLLKESHFRNSFKVLPRGNTYKDLSTIIIIPTPGAIEEKTSLNCSKCKHKNEYTKTIINGLNPVVVESWKRMIKPMNVPILELMVNGHEVSKAYTAAIEMVLSNPPLAKFRYILTMEHDNIVPYMAGTQGPLMCLYEDIEKGYDVAGGLYWTKGNPSMPLIYGDPKAKNDDPEGFFKVRHNWKPGDIIECNGMGMGFTLFKMDIFKDNRIEKPWFKTVQEQTEKGPTIYTQDLYFFEKIRKFNYKVCVDTRVRLGHMDLSSGVIY